MSTEKKPSRLRFIIPSSITKLFSRTDRHRRQLLKELLSEITLDFQQNEKKFTNAQNLAETLIKSLEPEDISNLKSALVKKTHVSPCVTIKREFNQNKKLTAYHLPIHIVCCKVWRWPEICRVGDIVSSDFCANQYANARRNVCINPYHYDKKKSETSNLSSGFESTYQSTESLLKSLASSAEFVEKAPTPKLSKKILYMSTGVRDHRKPLSGNKLRRVKQYESDGSGAKITFGSSDRILLSQKKSGWTSEYSLESMNNVKINFGSYDSVLSPSSTSSGSGAITEKTNQASSEYSTESIGSSDDYLRLDDFKNSDSSALLRSLNSIPDYASFGLDPDDQKTEEQPSSTGIQLFSEEKGVADYQSSLLSPASTLTASETSNNNSPLTGDISIPDFQCNTDGISDFFSSFGATTATDLTPNLQNFHDGNGEVSTLPASTNTAYNFDTLQSAGVNSYNGASNFMGRVPRNISQSNDELNSGYQENLLSTLSSSLDLLADPSIEFFPGLQSNQLQSTTESNNFGLDLNFDRYQNELSNVGSNYYPAASSSSDVAGGSTTLLSGDQGTAEYQDDNTLLAFIPSLDLAPASVQEFQGEIRGNQEEQSATIRKWYTDNNGNNNLLASKVSNVLSTQEARLPQKTRQWAHINYFEFSTRVGELFPCNYPKIIVDDSTTPSTFDKFSLGNLGAFNEKKEDETRGAVGKGVLLAYENGNLCITCLSDSSIFIQSINYNYKHKVPSTTVLQLETGQTLEIFNNSEFTTVLGDKVSLGYHAVYDLIKMCTIRLGFADRWGPGCEIENITSVARWIEIYMQEPRKWLDRVLIEMENPDDFLDLLP